MMNCKMYELNVAIGDILKNSNVAHISYNSKIVSANLNFRFFSAWARHGWLLTLINICF